MPEQDIVTLKGKHNGMRLIYLMAGKA